MSIRARKRGRGGAHLKLEEQFLHQLHIEDPPHQLLRRGWESGGASRVFAEGCQISIRAVVDGDGQKLTRALEPLWDAIGEGRPGVRGAGRPAICPCIAPALCDRSRVHRRCCVAGGEWQVACRRWRVADDVWSAATWSDRRAYRLSVKSRIPSYLGRSSRTRRAPGTCHWR